MIRIFKGPLAALRGMDCRQGWGHRSRNLSVLPLFIVASQRRVLILLHSSGGCQGCQANLGRGLSGSLSQMAAKAGLIGRLPHFHVQYFSSGVGRVPWTARRSNQSILKEISPGCFLEGLMLKLKLQYFGHLMQRAASLEKTLMLGSIEGRRRG